MYNLYIKNLSKDEIDFLIHILENKFIKAEAKLVDPCGDTVFESGSGTVIDYRNFQTIENGIKRLQALGYGSQVGGQ